MAYEQMGSYWMSDDFERFYQLVASRVPVLILGRAGRDRRPRLVDYTRIGLQKYAIKHSFQKYQWVFLDPALVVNPELADIVPKLPPNRLDVPTGCTGEWFNAIRAIFAAFRGRSEKIAGRLSGSVGKWGGENLDACRSEDNDEFA